MISYFGIQNFVQKKSHSLYKDFKDIYMCQNL